MQKVSRAPKTDRPVSVKLVLKRERRQLKGKAWCTDVRLISWRLPWTRRRRRSRVRPAAPACGALSPTPSIHETFNPSLQFLFCVWVWVVCNISLLCLSLPPLLSARVMSRLKVAFHQARVPCDACPPPPSASRWPPGKSLNYFHGSSFVVGYFSDDYFTDTKCSSALPVPAHSTKKRTLFGHRSWCQFGNGVSWPVHAMSFS